MSAESRKGHVMERLVANFLRVFFSDTRIDIRPKNGTKDRGDIGGLRTIRGADFVLEVKNHTRLDLSGWMREAELERGNADAGGAAVVFKRAGKGAAADQYVLMDLGTFAWLLDGGPVDFGPVVVTDPHTQVVA